MLDETTIDDETWRVVFLYGAGRRGFQRNRCATLWIQAGLVVQLVAAKRLRRGSGGRVDDGRFWASIPRPLRP